MRVVCLSLTLVVACGDDDSGGGGGGGRPQGEALTGAVLLGETNCWRTRAAELVACMNAGTPSAGSDDVSISGVIAADNQTCAEAGTTRAAIIEPAATPGGLSGWTQQSWTFTLRNGDVDCGTIGLAPSGLCDTITIANVSGSAESERCSIEPDAPDTRYCRLECSDGTLFTANAVEVNAVWNSMPRVVGTSGGANNLLLEIHAGAHAISMSCRY